MGSKAATSTVEVHVQDCLPVFLADLRRRHEDPCGRPSLPGVLSRCLFLALLTAASEGGARAAGGWRVSSGQQHTSLQILVVQETVDIHWSRGCSHQCQGILVQTLQKGSTTQHTPQCDVLWNAALVFSKAASGAFKGTGHSTTSRSGRWSSLQRVLRCTTSVLKKPWLQTKTTLLMTLTTMDHLCLPGTWRGQDPA
ncbi:hypothetical protein V5799_008934 [Amblyomma americanum]|uniref:Uncharacterized protein n=1 Tax=Amblyomma americanum TaxID=6943 RepID=A0AAQ4FD95_AMBAM